jgi:Histone methylation protein DOT1
MATPGIKVRKALEFVMQQHRNDHNLIHHYKKSASSGNNVSSSSSSSNNSAAIHNINNLTFIDLGSGDGEAVWQATQLGYKHAIGIEINWTLVALARLRRRLFWTRQQQARSTFLYQDMLAAANSSGSSASRTSTDHYLSSCHACMIFGVQPLMETLSRKLARTCQPGTFVLSYRFQLPTQAQQAASTTTTTTTTTTDTEQRSEDDLLNAKMVYNEQEMRIYKVLGSSTPSSKDLLKQQQEEEQQDNNVVVENKETPSNPSL